MNCKKMFQTNLLQKSIIGNAGKNVIIQAFKPEKREINSHLEERCSSSINNQLFISEFGLQNIISGKNNYLIIHLKYGDFK